MLKIEGNIVDVLNREIFKGYIVVNDEKIVDIKKCDVNSDLYILPGLIDSHVHIESSMLVPSEYAKIAVTHGVVACVTDPHEIANVLGIDGIDFMIDNSKAVPFKFYFGAPSCVPATSFETSGAKLDSEKVTELLKRDDIFFLSEMMNFPGVIFNDEDVIKKLESAKAYKKPIDGHAPMLSGNDLIKYVNSGISTDHECFNVNEAIEKIKLGMKILIREGSAAKNFNALFSLIDLYPNMTMICTDDTHPDDLIEGYINKIIKKGIHKKLNIFNLLQAATINPIKHYNLNVGLLQLNDPADFIIVDNLNDFNILKTYINGNLVAENKKSYLKTNNSNEINNFICEKITCEDIKVNYTNTQIKVIKLIKNELITESEIVEPNVINNEITTDITNDILKIVVINRYKKQKPVVGFVKGFQLSKGAIASCIAHDSHNIISVGTSDSDIVHCINEIIDIKGGISISNQDEKLILPLNIAGIMSNDDAYYVANLYQKINEKVKEFGTDLNAPFMTLSFLALLVIPHLKIGDKGLFDTDKFQFTSLYV